MTGTCSVPDCGRVGRVIKGVCGMHDARMRAWGHYGTADSLRPRGRLCSVSGCDSKHSGNGYCGAHLRRVRLYGSPLADQPLDCHSRLTSRTCVAPDCTAKHWAKGYCRKHYRRWAANGHTDLLSFEERFWRQVDRREPDACWPWTGATIKGYGHSHWGREHYYAHRKSWELAFGPIPDGMVVRHRCDNPPCVNPAHLEVGTQADNVADMIARGRGHWQGGAA